MKKFEEFKKELKKIDTKTMLKKEKDQWMYQGTLKENEIVYNLYYHRILLSNDESTQEILELIKKYNYKIDSNNTINDAVKNAKQLNKKIALIVNLED